MAQNASYAQAALYGISNSNRIGADLWGKNQFNSTFPTALVCYMRDNGIPIVYLSVNAELNVVATEITVDELFNTTRPNSELRFDFEAKYAPYQRFALNDIKGIDLVVKHNNNAEDAWRRPLEVKLTVLPDNTTCNLPEAEWGTELVIRPASTKYCALGIIDSCENRLAEVRDIFEMVCGTFQHWDSSHEVCAKRVQLLEALNQFQRSFMAVQKPFLMQPLWKTQGKSPLLCDQAFDVFVWSDFALCRAFLDKSLEGPANEVNRYMRSSARLARVLYTLSASGRADIDRIYTEMAFNLQTDKEFSLPGQSTKSYMNSPRRAQLRLPKTVVTEIILNGGQRMLSPERRFDASIYFTAEEIFEEMAQEAISREAIVEAMEAAGLSDPAALEEIAEEVTEEFRLNRRQ